MAISQTYCDWATGNDYSGASFVNGAFVSGTLTLTKAGAFAASKLNHWLYLSDNGSGEVTPGYYRVTNIAGVPNSVVLNADIRSGVNDPTDVVCVQATGAIGVPWRSAQGAFDLIVRNAVDGDQVNVKSGSAQVNAAALTLATYGAPGVTAPLILRGYTAAANDGGFGEINCNGATMWASTGYDSIVMVDLEMHSFGNNPGISLDDNIHLIHCEIHQSGTNAGTQVMVSIDYGVVANCYFHDGGGWNNNVAASLTSGAFLNNYVGMGTQIREGSRLGIGYISVIGNVFTAASTTAAPIIQYGTGYHTVLGNVLYNSTAGTSAGILFGDAVNEYGVLAMNNIIAGWSGVGGRGIASSDNVYITGYNAFYNCTTNYSIADQTFVNLSASDVALLADPFTNAAGGDFSLTAAVQALLRSEGWPESYLGASTDPHLTIGVVQYGDAPVPCDYPLPADVENGVVYGSGAYTGTLVCPAGGGGARPGCRWPDYKRRFDT